MAEVLGTTIGVVSLGIQICDKITEYIHDFNTRDEQLGNVLRRAQHVKHLLGLLERLARDLASSQPEAGYIVTTQIAACGKELETLRDFARELAPIARPADDLREKMRERAKRYTFPFSRADIGKLEVRLEKAAQTLSLAVDCLQLHSQAAMQSDLDRLSHRLEEIHLMMQSWDTVPVQKRRGETMALALTDPSALRDMCDVVRAGSLSAVSTDHRTVTREYSYRRTRRSCGCRPRRLRSIEVSPSWLSFSVLQETVEDRIHEPSCPYFKINPGQTSWSTALSFTGLRRYLSMAVSIGLMTRRGAGGCSISPVLQYRRTVKNSASPAFVLANALAEAFSFCAYPSLREPLIDAALEALRQTYANKQALPTDVNQLGATVLTWFCHGVFWQTNAGIYFGIPQDTCMKMLRARQGQGTGGGKQSNFSLLWRVIGGMLDLGIPTQGIGTGVYAMPVTHDLLNLSVSLQETVSAEDLSKITRYSDQDFAIKCHEYFPIHPLYLAFMSIEARELILPVYGLDNDLTLALIRQDEKELQDVLRRGQRVPLKLKENTHGSIEFAMKWPRGLALILEQRAATDIDGYLADGATVLKAMSIGLATCSNDPNNDTRIKMCEPDCECSIPLRFLLEAGCHVDMAQVNWGFATLRSIHVLLSYIKRGREALKELSRSTVPPDLQSDLDLDTDTVLDYRASQVTRLLQSHGINPAERLGWPRHDIRLKDPRYFGEDSVYHWINTISSAKIAYSLGFEDVDGVNDRQLTPLAIQSLATDLNGKWDVDPEYLTWLVERGASLERMCSHSDQSPGQPSKPTIAHHIMAKAAKRTVKKKYYLRDWHRLLVYAGQMDTCDGCECGCAEPGAGCSPLSVFLRQTFNTCVAHHGWPEHEIVAKLALSFSAHEALGKSMARPLIRLLAFRALEIRHTCCNESILQACPASAHDEDFAELRSEDAALLKRLEEVVGELNASFDSSGLSVFAFLKEWGMAYLQDVAGERQGSALTAEEKIGIESVGVRLGSAHAGTQRSKKAWTRLDLSRSDPNEWDEKYWDREREWIGILGRTIWFDDNGTFRSRV